MRTLEHALVAKHLITADDIVWLDQEASEQGKTFEEVVLENELLTEIQFKSAQAEFYGLEMLAAVSEEMVDTELICRFTITYLKKHQIVPLRGADGVVVGMADPFSLKVLNDFSLLLGGGVPSPVLLPRNVITGLINRAFGDFQEDANVSDVLNAVLYVRV